MVICVLALNRPDLIQLQVAYTPQIIVCIMQAGNLNFARGVALAKSNNYSEALRAFTSAIQQNPSRFTAYLNRGCIECLLGLDEFAIEDFNKVI